MAHAKCVAVSIVRQETAGAAKGGRQVQHDAAAVAQVEQCRAALADLRAACRAAVSQRQKCTELAGTAAGAVAALENAACDCGRGGAEPPEWLGKLAGSLLTSLRQCRALAQRQGKRRTLSWLRLGRAEKLDSAISQLNQLERQAQWQQWQQAQQQAQQQQEPDQRQQHYELQQQAQQQQQPTQQPTQQQGPSSGEVVGVQPAAAEPGPELRDGSPATSAASCLSAGASAELQRRVTPPALCWLESGGFRIEWGDLERVRVVGETSHGQVWQGRWQETDVAIKQLECLAEGAGLEERGEGGPLQRDASGGVHGCSGLYAALEREAKLLRGLLHPNIVLFLGVSLDPPAIVTEHCARGTLLALLNAARSSRQLAAALSWQRRLQMAMDAAKGMLHLHSHKPPILHRNLKSTKLLVDKDWRVKVADLSLAASDTLAPCPAWTNPRWRAPEVLRGQASSTAADVYAFGLILWELLTWQPPFPGLSAFQIIHAVTERGERPAVPDAAAAAQLPGGSFACLHEYTALMQRCWAEEADQRPTFEQIIADLRRAESKLAMS